MLVWMLYVLKQFLQLNNTEKVVPVWSPNGQLLVTKWSPIVAKWSTSSSDSMIFNGFSILTDVLVV